MITKYKLFIESITQTLDYDSESKSMIGVYKVVNTDPENTTIENKQEFNYIKELVINTIRTKYFLNPFNINPMKILL